jgi:starch synthase
MVIVSHPTGNTFSTAVVEAIYEADLLAAFYTCVVWRRESLIAKVTPRILRSKLERRSRINLPSDLVHTRPFRELVRNAFMYAGKRHVVSKESSSYSVQSIYRDLDAYITRDLKKYPAVRAVYAYEDGAADQFREARNRGMKCIYDLPIGYWRANVKMSLEEAELQPGWKGTLNVLNDSEAKRARKDLELELADTVVVPSTFVKNTLDMYPGKKNIVVNPFGVPGNRSAPRELTSSDKPLRVLYVGALTQRKGIAYLFEAIEKAGKAVTLTVIGRKVGHSKLLDQNCDKHRWLPTLPHPEILAEMSRHDVFVFPSLFEGRRWCRAKRFRRGCL